MKTLKKYAALVMATILALSVLAGCGSDPVADDFEKFINTDMVDVNANYQKIKTESAKWSDFETNDELVDSIENTILPAVNDSIDKLSKINPETDEVKNIKAKYEKVMAAYKDGYEKMLEACKSNDEELANTGSKKIDEGLKLLDEYNKALESLAKEKDMKVEY